MHRFLQLWHFLLKDTWPSVIPCMFYHMRIYLERYVQTGMKVLKVELLKHLFICRWLIYWIFNLSICLFLVYRGLLLELQLYRLRFSLQYITSTTVLQRLIFGQRIQHVRKLSSLQDAVLLIPGYVFWYIFSTSLPLR